MEELTEVNSWFSILVILLNQACVAFSMGATVSSLNSASPAIAVFVNETYTQRHASPSPEDYNKLVVVLIQSSLAWGSLIGALLVRTVIKMFSRKGAVAVSHVLNICSVILMSPVAKQGRSYEALIIGRILNGVARGIGYGVVPVVVAETTCHRRLAFFQGPFIIMMYLGAAVGVGLGHRKSLGTPTLWPWLNAFPAMLSVVFLVLSPWLPQTPAYHLKSGDRSSARATLRKLRRGDNAAIDKELAQIENEIETDSNVHTASPVELIKNAEYRKQMIAAFITLNCTQLAGHQAVLFYSDDLFREAGVGEENVTYASIGIFASSIVPGSIALFLIRRIGTKKTFLIGSALAAIGLISFTMTTALKGISDVMPTISIAAMGLYLFGNYLGIDPNIFAIPSELTTQTTRPTAIFLSTIGIWLIASLVGFIFPYSLSAWGAFAYIPFIVGLIGVMLYVVISVPNMHKKSVAQIQKRLSAPNALQLAKRKQIESISVKYMVNEAFE